MMVVLFLAFLFISSFVLFVASRHDFVLLRQNISIRHIFDRAFIILFFSLVLSRAIYLANEKMYDFLLNPLRFLHVILFFGFDLLGMITAFSLGVVMFFHKRKNFLRIFDIYLLTFFPIVIFEAVYHLIAGDISILINSGYLVIALLFFLLFIRMHTGFKIKDGVVGFSILIFTALSYLGYTFLRNDILIYSPVQILAILIMAISIYCLILVQINFFKEK